MKTQVDTVIRRTQQYNFEDGLTEAFIGALAALGGLVILTAQFPFIAFGLFFVGVILITKILDRIRERNTYPRSGYLAYKEHKSKLWVTLLIAMICLLAATALIVLALLYDYDHALAWPSLIVGLFVGGVLLYKGIQLRLKRIILLGALTILFGFVCSPVVLRSEATEGYNGLATFGLFFFAVGVIFLISGGLRFRKYLQENSLPVEVLDD
jgi:hypothetical protein